MKEYKAKKEYLERFEVLKLLNREYQKAFTEDGIFAAAAIHKIKELIEEMPVKEI